MDVRRISASVSSIGPDRLVVCHTGSRTGPSVSTSPDAYNVLGR